MASMKDSTTYLPTNKFDNPQRRRYVSGRSEESELASYLDEIRHVSSSHAHRSHSKDKKESIDWSMLMDSGEDSEEDMISSDNGHNIRYTNSLFLKSSSHQSNNSSRKNSRVMSEILTESSSNKRRLSSARKVSLASVKLNTEELLNSESDLTISSSTDLSMSMDSLLSTEKIKQTKSDRSSTKVDELESQDSDTELKSRKMSERSSSLSDSSRSIVGLRQNIFSVDQLDVNSDDESSVMNTPSSITQDHNLKSECADTEPLERTLALNIKSSFSFGAKSLQDNNMRTEIARGNNKSVDSVITDPEEPISLTSEDSIHEVHDNTSFRIASEPYSVASDSFSVESESPSAADTVSCQGNNRASTSQDDYTADFSEVEQLNRSDLTESRQDLLFHDDTSMSERVVHTRDAGIQTSLHQLNPGVDIFGSGSAHPTVTIDTHYGKEYLSARPVMLSADALEAVTAYSPSVVALNDMLRLQLNLTRQLVDTNRRLVASFTSSLKPNYHYTSLQDTKQFISQNRPTKWKRK